jgi:kynurenine formamidase/glycosyltransferase involved in cell wall biosynthesis
VTDTPPTHPTAPIRVRQSEGGSGASPLSVVIRCYNEEKHLGRLLAGLRGQDLADVEVILVDSGSSDASPAIAASYGARVLQIPKREFSFGRSLNLGCAAATGDIVVAVSAHCYPIYPDWLQRLTRPLADPKVAMAYGMQRGNHLNRFSEHRIFRQWFGERSDFAQATPFANNANSAFRRSVWEAIPFDETLTGLEDLDWAHRIMRQGHRIAYVAEAPVVHVHEETWPQIYNRYRREAIAMRRILPHERFGALDFLRLFGSSVLYDAGDAWRQGRFAREALGILRFRWCQYLGTYRGYRQRDGIDEGLRQTFYYPAGLTPGPAELRPDPARRPIPYTGPPRDGESGVVPGIIDVSTPVDRPIPVWPGDPRPEIRKLMSLEAGDEAAVSTLAMCVHTGTHIDAPAHFIPAGASMGEIGLDRFIGPVWVAEFDASRIGVEALEAARIPRDCSRLLLRTRNSALWREGNAFRPDFVALTPEGAQWVVDRGIRLVGIDYLSIERYQEPNHRTHQILLEAGVVVVEGLDLSRAAPGDYELLCLPLRLDGAEGAPARVVLRKGVPHAA